MTVLLRRLISRLLQMITVVAIVTTVVFCLLHLAPGDPFSSAMDHPNVTEAVRQHWITAYGLDRPILEQYWRYLGNVAQGDLGWSFSMRRPVLDVLLDALPYTIILTGIALLIGFAGGIALGVFQARRVGSKTDSALSGVSMMLNAVPDFWLALLLMLGFAYWLPIFPVSGAFDAVMYDYLSPWGKLIDRVQHLALPVATLSILLAANISRYQRSELLRILPEEFVNAARAKGVTESRIVWHHALRNALLPIISMLGLSLPLLFTGAVFVEKIFAWPGMGWTIVNAVSMRDYPLVTAGVIVTSATVALGSVLADLLYSFADPRVTRNS